MGKGKRRSKKKAMPKKTDSDGPAAAAPAPDPRQSSGGAAAKAAEGMKCSPVANRACINCDNCGKADPRKCCSGCFCFYYCSKECQLQHWKHHRPECALLKDRRDRYNAAREKKDLPGGTPAVIDGPCAICLEEEVKNPVTFQCGHTFCFKCIHIYQYKEKQATCPHCRGEIPDVLGKAGERTGLYIGRAEAAQEGSEERKKYCHLAIAEYDTVSQVCRPQSLLYYKARILSMSKNPEELLKVTDKILSDKILSGSQSGGFFKLAHERVVQTKLWRAQAYSEMGKWTDASECYSELRKENQLGDSWNEFLLEMGHCRCFFYLGDYRKAVECGNQAVSICRTIAGAHEYLALSQKAAGDIDAAKNTMLKAILYEEQWNVENKEKNKQILRDL